MSDPVNPFLDDDDDEEVTVPKFRLQAPVAAVSAPPVAPVAAPVARTPVVTPPAPKVPAFGEKGFRKGVPNPHAGSPRARITQADAEVLAFLAVFRAATVEALSLLRVTQASNVSEGGELTKVSGTQKRLEKLRRLGAVDSFKGADGVRVWGVSEKGIAAVQLFGLLGHDALSAAKGLQGMSFTQLGHYRSISLVAAKFMSPVGYFRESLGLEPVKLEELVSENQIRAAQMPIREALFEAKKSAKNVDGFGRWRTEKLKELLAEAKEGKLAWHEITACYPELWTLGQPQKEFSKDSVLASHWPDLVVSREAARKGARSASVVVEIELSKKRLSEYEALLRTFSKELELPVIYGRIAYFTTDSQVETLLRRADERGGFGLFEKKQLVVLPLTDRDNNPVRINNRITV